MTKRGGRLRSLRGAHGLALRWDDAVAIGERTRPARCHERHGFAVRLGQQIASALHGVLIEVGLLDAGETLSGGEGLHRDGHLRVAARLADVERLRVVGLGWVSRIS